MALSCNGRGAKSLDADSRAKLRARLHEAGGLAGWMIAVEKGRASSLWQGRAGQGRQRLGRRLRLHPEQGQVPKAHGGRL